MKIVLVLALLTTLNCLSIRNHFHQKAAFSDDPSHVSQSTEEMIIGGFTGRNVDGTRDLEEGQKIAEQFIEESLPEIKDYQLIRVREQVVAGMNYCFSYKAKDASKVAQNLGKKVELCVWSKPWENNFLAFQTPDGRHFISGLAQPEPATTLEVTAVRTPTTTKND